jgi:hypothetical protein
LKSINNFGNLVKNISEENAKIKPPTRDYTEIDLGREKYNNNNNLERPKFTIKPSETNEELQKPKLMPSKQMEPIELQRPTFSNKNLENKNTNFKELDTHGDVRIKYNTLSCI